MSKADDAPQRLKSAGWLSIPQIQAVFAALDGDAGRTRVVGGAVRDTLLGRSGETVEVDLATVLLPDEVVARAKAKGIAAIPTGIAFGTVTLVIDGVAFEVTTLRHDVETDGRHAVVRFGTDWTEDARRRDFTLNALYCGPDGTLHDPLGGLEDCLAGRVRFIGDPAERIAEDRLRIFRFFRFSASHGGERFDEAGLAASAAASGALGPLSAERIGHEMVRILALKRCAKTLRTMSECGLVSADEAALAALGRLETLTSAPGVAERLVLLAGGEGVRALQSAWRLSNATVKQAQLVAVAADLIAADKLAEAAYRYPDGVAAGLAVSAARGGWTPERLADMRETLAAFAPPVFPISGAKLIRHGHTAGPQLGALLARLEQEWIDSAFTLSEADLLALAAAELG